MNIKRHIDTKLTTYQIINTSKNMKGGAQKQKSFELAY